MQLTDDTYSVPKIINLKEPHFPSNENEENYVKQNAKEKFTSVDV